MKTVLTVVVLLIIGALRLFEYRHRDYCENECPYMKQFINEDSDGNIETNHSDGRA